MISVILPVYNGSQYLCQSIESVLNQTYSDLELICVDDGSTDESDTIISAFKEIDQRVRYILHPKNLGLPAALNTGYQAAKGDLITWTSHDNWYEPLALAMMRWQLNRTGADLVYAGCNVLKGSGRSSSIIAPPHMIAEYNVVHACFLHKRSIYEKIGGYDENLFRAEDWDYWLRTYAAGFKFEPLYMTLYNYRDHPDSLTRAQRTKCIAQARKAFRKNIGKLPITPWQRIRAEGVNLFRGYF